MYTLLSWLLGLLFFPVAVLIWGSGAIPGYQILVPVVGSIYFGFKAQAERKRKRQPQGSNSYSEYTAEPNPATRLKKRAFRSRSGKSGELQYQQAQEQHQRQQEAGCKRGSASARAGREGFGFRGAA